MWLPAGRKTSGAFPPSVSQDFKFLQILKNSTAGASISNVPSQDLTAHDTKSLIPYLSGGVTFYHVGLSVS